MVGTKNTLHQHIQSLDDTIEFLMYLKARVPKPCKCYRNCLKASGIFRYGYPRGST